MNHQLALCLRPNIHTTLSDFCWEANPLLQQQIEQSLSKKGDLLFYLWGNTGCGKSHLLSACCHELDINEPSIYLPLRTLKEWGPESIEDIGEQSLIAIDDIEAISKNSLWEEALFHLYNKIRDKGKTLLIITGNLPPHALPHHLQDLKSRLSWGVVTQLNELSDEAKIKILQQHALKRGFTLENNAGLFLINRCARNMHDLNYILNRLDEASFAAQRSKITVPFVKSTLGL